MKWFIPMVQLPRLFWRGRPGCSLRLPPFRVALCDFHAFATLARKLSCSRTALRGRTGWRASQRAEGRRKLLRFGGVFGGFGRQVIFALAPLLQVNFWLSFACGFCRGFSDSLPISRVQICALLRRSDFFNPIFSLLFILFYFIFALNRVEGLRLDSNSACCAG